jgi:hypothetical protein
MPLVAYLCIGAVVSAALGYAYMRHSGKLNDETMFRIVALVQGVDLDQLAKEGQTTAEETPAEEPSFAEQQQHLLAGTLQFDGKQRQLKDSLAEFDSQLKRLSAAQERYTQLRAVVERFLKEQQAAVEDVALAKVRAQLEALIPKKQAKPILIKMIQDGQVDQVILLLSGMKPRIQQEILRTFDQPPEDIDMLYQMQKHMLTDNPARPIIEKQIEALDELKSQDE